MRPVRMKHQATPRGSPSESDPAPTIDSEDVSEAEVPVEGAPVEAPALPSEFQDWNADCAGDEDCDTGFCAMQPGAPAGFCTRLGCAGRVETMCPADYTCFDLATMLNDPAMPNFCDPPAAAESGPGGPPPGILSGSDEVTPESAEQADAETADADVVDGAAEVDVVDGAAEVDDGKEVKETEEVTEVSVEVPEEELAVGPAPASDFKDWGVTCAGDDDCDTGFCAKMPTAAEGSCSRDDCLQSPTTMCPSTSFCLDMTSTVGFPFSYCM